MSKSAEKQPEAALPSSSLMACHQVTLSALGDAVLTTDPEGRVTYMNPEAETLTGWVAGDAYGRPSEDVLRILDEETRQAAEQSVRKVIETGLVHGLGNHTLLIARDGTERPINDRAVPVRDEAGDLIGVALVFRDTGEQRRRERAAQDALVYAESIVDTVRDPLLILDADLRVRSASRSFYETFAVDPAATEGRLVYELGNGQWDIPQLRTLLEDILPEGDSFRDFELTHDFEGLGRRRMLLNGRKVYRPGNDSGLILLAIEDTSSTWRAGVDFASNRERYRVIVEGATGFAIFTFDTDGIITSWNVGAETMLGYPEAEMLGRNIRVIYTPEDIVARQADQEMRTAAAEGRALDERWHLRKGGERFWAQGLVMPLKDDTDELRGFLKIINDKTEERHLQEALQRRTAELEEADVHKNEFLAMLAHELRNPLAAIRNAVTLATRSGTREDLEWSRDVTARQVKNFAHLIDDLLDASRISQGKIQLHKEVIDAVPVLRHAVEAVRPLVEERKHELLLSFTSTDLRIEVDATRLEQMLVNLLTNAAKYTPSGGRIQLIAGMERGEFVCRVRDNGLGISPELLSRMFDLFAQADRSLARSEGGLGIGLTLVRSLAELHGGTIAAVSDGPDKGSEFILRLPAAVNPVAPASRPPDGSEEVPIRSLRVLVVDDNEDSANGMAMLLRLSGHTARVAHSGSDALALGREHGPEVVILDIGLPGMDGYEVAARCGERIAARRPSSSPSRVMGKSRPEAARVRRASTITWSSPSTSIPC
jgi:PAS domain S-box-containing protein